MTALTPLHKLWLTETVRLREEHAGPLEDQEANRLARAAGGDLPTRIQQRALHLAERDGLTMPDGLRNVQWPDLLPALLRCWQLVCEDLEPRQGDCHKDVATSQGRIDDAAPGRMAAQMNGVLLQHLGIVQQEHLPVRLVHDDGRDRWPAIAAELALLFGPARDQEQHRRERKE